MVRRDAVDRLILNGGGFIAIRCDTTPGVQGISGPISLLYQRVLHLREHTVAMVQFLFIRREHPANPNAELQSSTEASLGRSTLKSPQE
jgi:hypothetical protein